MFLWKAITGASFFYLAVLIYFAYMVKISNIQDKKSTINTKNNILAIEAAPAAIPVNPNSAAILATTKNITAQRNMIVIF